jgi:YVTN family beta-propeller protein
MQAHLKRRFPVLVALGVLMLLATGGPLHRPPTTEGAATVIATVPSGGNAPFHIAVNPAANLVFVTNNSSGDVSVLDNNPPFGAAALPIPIGGNPTGVAYDASSNAVFVDEATGALVFPFLAAPPFTSLGPPIITGTSPVWVVANPNNSRIYVANQNQPDVGVFDTAAPGFPFIASLPQLPCAPGFPGGSLPTGVAINPTTNQIYVTMNALNQLWVMDGAAPWGCLPPIPVGAGPTGVTYNPVNNHIYVANRFSNDLTVIDASTFAVLNPSLPVGANPWEVAVNPGMNHVYVTNAGSNNVTVIDGSTDAVVETVPVGSSPQGLAVDPANNRVFVANLNDNTISVIEDMPVVAPAPTPTPTVGPAPPPPSGGMEQIPLFGRTCTPVASTYPNATPIATIAGAVTPGNVLESLWEFGGTNWQGYSPQFPAASNLTQLDRLDVVFICVSGSGAGAATFERPVI